MIPRLVGRRFPYLPLQLKIGSVSQDIEAFFDNGFDGDLLVPRALLPPGLVPATTATAWRLADGSAVLADEYYATVGFGPLGRVAAVITVLGHEPLIGRGLAEFFAITLDHGQTIIVEP